MRRVIIAVLSIDKVKNIKRRENATRATGCIETEHAPISTIYLHTYIFNIALFRYLTILLVISVISRRSITSS